MKIVSISPQLDWTLIIEFDDGKRGSFDVVPYLDLEVFQPLKNIAEFNQAQNGGYYIEWPCGADLSSDTIEAHLKLTDVAAG